MNCCYILKPANVNEPAIYCGKATRYHIILDDDKNKVRKYNHFCDEHQVIIDATNQDEDY